MYGNSARFEPSMFEGLDLESISYASNAVQLSFSGGIAITSMTWVEYCTDGDGDTRRDNLPVSSSSLMRLIGNRVTAGERTERGGLTLTFTGGGCVVVDDDSLQYECFSITTPDAEIFV